MNRVITACISLLLLSSNIAIAQSQPDVVVEPAVEEFTDQELDQILAPIALYPDTVLAHVLIAATYPLEVVQAARWTERNEYLEGDKAIKAVENEDWDPSVKALVAFPDLLQRMSDDLDWMQKIGDAFLEDEERITSRIQVLRRHAYEEGNLETLEHLKVVEEEEVIVIEPVVKEVVYVPYYDTRYVYGNWWWDRYPPVFWRHPRHHHSHYYTTFYWGPRVHLSWGFFFSGFHWHNRHIVVLDHYHHRPHYYYTSRQVVRHRDSHRWHHNPRHRRGVDYRNPRTRDYFERQRSASINSSSNRSTTVSRVRSDRNSRDDNIVSSRRIRPDADSVRGRLDESRPGNSRFGNNDDRSTGSSRSREALSESGDRSRRSGDGSTVESKKQQRYSTGNVKLGDREKSSTRTGERGSRVRTESSSGKYSSGERSSRSSSKEKRFKSSSSERSSSQVRKNSSRGSDRSTSSRSSRGGERSSRSQSRSQRSR